MITHVEQGKGVPLVLIHGFAANNSIWENLLPSLNSFHIYCPNLPCIGLSSGDPNKISMKYVAQSLAEWMDKNRISKAFILGHSMGGYIAMSFTKLFPEKVIGIGLINATPLADNEVKINNRKKTAQFIIDNGSNQFLSMSIPLWFAINNRATYKKEIDLLISNAMQISDHVLYQYQIAMANRPDLITWFQNLKKPKLLILGQEDELIPTQELDYLKNNPSINYHIVPHCGHMSMIEQQEILSKIIISFVESYS